jgi:hypothetical protein
VDRRDAGGSDPLLGVGSGTPGTPRIAYAIRDWAARLGLVAAGSGSPSFRAWLWARCRSGQADRRG